MSYYAQLLLAWRGVDDRVARKYAANLIGGSPSPYMASAETA